MIKFLHTFEIAIDLFRFWGFLIFVNLFGDDYSLLKKKLSLLIEWMNPVSMLIPRQILWMKMFNHLGYFSFTTSMKYKHVVIQNKLIDAYFATVVLNGLRQLRLFDEHHQWLSKNWLFLKDSSWMFWHIIWFPEFHRLFSNYSTV